MALASDCISRSGLRVLAVAALMNKTLAGSTVFDPHTTPITTDKLPALVVSTPAERKNTAGSGAPQFNTTVTLAVMARVASGPEKDTEAALDTIVEQVQQAILCTPAMVAPVQRFEFVETQLIVTPESGRFVGEAVVMFGLEVFQLYEPDAGEPFLGFDATVPATDDGPPVKFSSDLPQ